MKYPMKSFEILNKKENENSVEFLFKADELMKITIFKDIKYQSNSMLSDIKNKIEVLSNNGNSETFLYELFVHYSLNFYNIVDHSIVVNTYLTKDPFIILEAILNALNLLYKTNFEIIKIDNTKIELRANNSLIIRTFL